MRVKIILSLAFLVFASNIALAQISDSQMSKGQGKLNELNVSEVEIKAKMLQRGIDMDNIQPEDAPRVERELQEVMAELQKEKGSTGAVLENRILDADPQGGDDIIERIEDGATYEEAVVEELSEEVQNASASVPIYGHHIFKNKQIELYRTNSLASTPDSYILDEGDNIMINIFGQSQADLAYTINDDGFIRPTNMYKIYLRGVSFGQAKVLLRKRFKQAYMFGSEQFSVSLETARTIRVNIVGEVQNPGTYTISALNTAINALIAAGGPSRQGSVRNISVKSFGKTKTLDIYKYLEDPSYLNEFYLDNNATIFVNQINNRVSIQGDFKNAGTFEMMKDERFLDLIELVGGIENTTHLGTVSLMRREAGKEQKITDNTYAYFSSTNLVLMDGDNFYFRSDQRSYRNFITVEGSVRFPGNFEIKRNTKLADIVKRSVPEENSKLDLAFISRKNLDGTLSLVPVRIAEALENEGSEANISIQAEDKLVIYTENRYTTNYTYSIEGAVREPMEHFWDPSESISIYDAIMLAGGLEPNATSFAYVVGKSTDNTEKVSYKVVNVEAALQNPASEDNILINPYDVIKIPNVGTYYDQFSIKITGAVRNPGEFVFDSTLDLKDALLMAGGIKFEGASNKIDILRLKVDENEPTEVYEQTISVDRALNPFSDADRIQLQPFDHIVVRMAPEFNKIQTVMIKGQVKYPGEYALVGDNMTISDLIERSGGITKTAYLEGGTLYRPFDNIGFVITKMHKIKGSSKSPNNLVLSENDIITIPSIVNTVKIELLGTEYKSSVNIDTISSGVVGVEYLGRARAHKYINGYVGGFDKDAKRRKTIVEEQNGRIRKTRSFLGLKIYPVVRPGSTIHLTLKEKKRKEKEDGEPKERVDIYKSMMDIFALATSAITVAILATKL